MKLKYTFLLAFTLPLLIWIMADTKKKVEKKYTENHELKTVNPSLDWKGTPLDENGRFVNLFHPFESSFGDLLKWQTSKNPYKEAKENETRQLAVNFDPSIIQGKEDYLIWLGHATYLFRVQGKTFLTDPILMDNTFLKRDSPLPFPIEEMPHLDYILLSHNHRDHCDKASLKFLAEHHPQAKILTALGVSKVITSWTNPQEIEEAGWFQQYTKPDADIKITFVPSRHWSRRWLWDDNKSLWGGFYIQTEEKSIYFMGDSGKGPHFEDIKNTLGSPDYCLMGVGAFRPEWFMHQAHISPTYAIEAFNTLGGRFFIPMHYGTFDLSDEPRMEPWDILIENRDAIQGYLIEPVIGQNLLFPNLD
ncbi:putative Zn-dependent hydrolase [Indibacter alkaliphilus LW1]|uniref:Zn-dependent hydrolase n=1 Tax=Indibacter alkaliphilus (strain CCUG 57479 / KCTC 22604 / LW1) TaxID=1189612 RepID=S2DZW9_INDAL|nr:MBL fold metallo-hydrolase [Indibacter alkaliphilus]EOZ95353.1 putative Zn-dependent hydrolase [Indibacter alkaliphilus LW1]